MDNKISSRVVFENEEVEVKFTNGLIPLVNRSRVTGKIISMEEAIKEELKDKYPDLDLDSIRIEIDDANDVLESDDEDLGKDDKEDVYEEEVAKYVVYQKVEKKVPYKVVEELVDTDLLTEAEDAMNKDELDKTVLDRLIRAGIISPDDQCDVVKVGAMDDGYDSPYGGYEVRRVVSKEKLEEDKEFADTDIDVKDTTETKETIDVKENTKEEVNKEEIEVALNRLKELRKKLETLEDIDERNKLLDDLFEQKNEIEEEIKKVDSRKASEVLEEKIKNIDNQIEVLSKERRERSKEFDKLYKELQAIIDEQYEKLSTDEVLSDEEIRSILEEYDRKKIEINGKSSKYSQKLDTLGKRISRLNRQKNKLKNDLQRVIELDLTYDEYKEIEKESINNRNTLEGIFASKGLENIIGKNDKERSKEEKAVFKKTKEEIVNEIAAFKKENDELSVREIIDILYEPDRVLDGDYKEISLSEEDINNIKTNADKEIKKVKNTNDGTINYVPGEAPKDMLSNVLTRGRVHIDDIYLRGLSKEETEERYREAILEDLEDNGFQFDSETMDINIVGAEVDEAASDIQYTAYEIIPKEKENEIEPKIDVKEEKEEVKVLKHGRVHIDDIYLRGLSKEETEARYDEEIIKDLESEGFEFDPETMRIVQVGAEVDEAASDIQYMAYEIHPRVKEDIDNDAKDTIIDNNDDETSDTDTIEEIDDEINQVRDVVERITFYRDTNTGDIYVRAEIINRFNLTPTKEGVDIGGFTGYRIDKEDAKYIENNQNNSYSPYVVEYKDITLENEYNFNNNKVVEKIVLYRDLDNDNNIYVRKSVIDRFTLDYIGDSRDVDGVPGYRISSEDEEYIKSNQNNSYSPYEVEYKDVHLGKTKEEVVEEKETTEDKMYNLDNPVLEKVVIYKDLNSGDYYVKKAVINRFNLAPIGSAKRIDGYVCFKIDEEDLRFVEGNKNNSYSPYFIENKEVRLEEDKSKEKAVVEEHEELKPIEEVEHRVYSINDEDNAKIKNTGSQMSNISGNQTANNANNQQSNTNNANGNQVANNANNQQPNTNNANGNQVANNANNQQPNTNNVNGNQVANNANGNQQNNTNQGPKKGRIHEEAIIAKLTKGLHIKNKDGKRYQASNIKVSKQFRDELHSGNYLYNIIHVVPNVLKTGISFLMKLGSKVLLTGRGKAAMKEVAERLNNLSEEELEVLFERYRGNRLKADMNLSIDPLILDRLKRYGLEKVEKLNNEIKTEYVLLFSLLGEIKSLEEKINNTNNQSAKKNLIVERKKLLKKAAGAVKNIEDKRTAANNLLSGGIHGMEEDFKAVSTKMNYVGLRFAKSNDFDNELQEDLGKYGQALNDAIANDDNEEIVNNFMALETLYYDNTEIKGSIFGKRSVGSKYYTPLAEQFNYNNDPFLRDLFTTIAVTSAAVSAINAVRVHQIESQELLKQQQAEAARVNQNNDNVMDYVHQTGAQIEGHRGVFQQGMEAQAHQDVLNSANAVERSALDYHNWSFGDAYRATDNANHEFYNAFHENVTNQLTDITTKYGTGSITQAQALQQMADVVNGSQSTLVQVANECMSILKPYADTHPQFDLTAVQESMDFIIAHPDAIATMNQGMVDVTNLAGGLAGLSAEHATALAGLPSDMVSTLVCAASAAALATRVATTAVNKYGKKDRRYGNEVTDMMEEYLNGLDDDDIQKML